MVTVVNLDCNAEASKFYWGRVLLACQQYTVGLRRMMTVMMMMMIDDEDPKSWNPWCPDSANILILKKKAENRKKLPSLCAF